MLHKFENVYKIEKKTGTQEFKNFGVLQYLYKLNPLKNLMREILDPVDFIFFPVDFKDKFYYSRDT